jgi:DNA-binding response OmpR family regulator
MMTQGGQRMILVVDDDRDIVQLLGRALEREGYSVESAFNGREAYERLKSNQCHCMVLDINMPNVNGWELLLVMQAEEIDVPTIVMAGLQDIDEEEMRPFRNVVGLFTKPFRVSDLLQRIRESALN